jgi:S-adenosylmethionine hydrolase
MSRPLITLTTDFGHGSPYVAQMKGVILSLCRDVDLIDITHAIGPQNIREGAVVLADATPRFPPDTLHVAVVDPGVGTNRRLIYAEIGGQRYLAPDNGLLSLLTSRDSPQQLRALENAAHWLPDPSTTFHGRDILAPVAAHLALGIDSTELGPPLDSLDSLDWPQPKRAGDAIYGEALYFDSFGNIVTNIDRPLVESLGDRARLSVSCGGQVVSQLVATYADAAPGELIVLFDSQGRLELAIVQGNATRELAIRAGVPVMVQRSP